LILGVAGGGAQLGGGGDGERKELLSGGNHWGRTAILGRGREGGPPRVGGDLAGSSSDGWQPRPVMGGGDAYEGRAGGEDPGHEARWPTPPGVVENRFKDWRNSGDYGQGFHHSFHRRGFGPRFQWS